MDNITTREDSRARLLEDIRAILEMASPAELAIILRFVRRYVKR